MTLQSFLRALGAPVQDAEEETFELFAQDLPSQNLGFIDPKAATVELTIAGRDLTVHQSPSILSSNRAGGTTGAVLWKITPLFAEWLASPTNPLFTHNVLTPTSLACELGCGISALVALLLAPRIARYVLTDQPYVAKLVEQNLAENNTASSSAAKPAAAAAAVARVGGRSRGRKEAASSSSSGRARIGFAPLDWETDVVTSALAGPGAGSFDVVVACDCIYNEALVEPFVATCVDVCRLRGDGGGAEREEEQQPCVCVVAQQLRDPLIFEAWATRFVRSFHAWRVPDELLVEGLRSSRGFVVHVGVLKGVIDLEAI